MFIYKPKPWKLFITSLYVYRTGQNVLFIYYYNFFLFFFYTHFCGMGFHIDLIGNHSPFANL